jgi:hypothetical protein
MSFRFAHTGGNCGTCEYIQATGEIMPDTARKFKVFFESREFKPSIIRLHSPGGSLSGGIEQGEAIRALKLSTEVGSNLGGDRSPGLCASACAYAFLGGIGRTFEKDSKLGFHQFFDEKTLSEPTAKLFSGKDLDESQRIMAAIVLYVTKLGVDPRLVAVAANTSPTDVRWFNEDDARALKVIYEPRAYNSWRVEPYKSGAIAITETMDGTKSIVVSCSRKFGPNVVLTDTDRSWNVSSWFEQCRDGLVDDNGPNVFGEVVPAERVHVARRKDGAAMMRFLLSSDSPPLTRHSFLTMADGYIHACDTDAFLGTEKNFIPSVPLALRNCIQDE